jgi:transcriptional regulator
MRLHLTPPDAIVGFPRRRLLRTRHAAAAAMNLCLRPAYFHMSIYKRGGVSDQTDVLQGTLDLLILRTIALGPMHGWAIAQRIQQISDDLLRVQQGSLYPALHRLEHQGWITAEWGTSENNRRARFYSLTRAGRKQLEAELAKWERLSAGVNLVLQRT